LAVEVAQVQPTSIHLTININPPPHETLPIHQATCPKGRSTKCIKHRRSYSG